MSSVGRVMHEQLELARKSMLFQQAVASSSWTGLADTAGAYRVQTKVQPMAIDLSVLERKPSRIQIITERSSEDLAEYKKYITDLEIDCPDLIIEEFKIFLNYNDFPVFNLQEVIKYMDAKAAKEGTGGGWKWLPLRPKDQKISGAWGVHAYNNGQSVRPASDYYQSGAVCYRHPIPLHALRKAALIDKTFGTAVGLAVTEYQAKPEFYPDPFLIAYIPHTRGNDGRFVIDLWDEPGFGLEQRLK